MASGKWGGSKPTECEVCGEPIESKFIDGRTVHGPWAKMCVNCHQHIGVGLGIGRGQYYELMADGSWVKVN